MERMIKPARASGLALMETVIVLPLLVLLVFGLIEYGWMFSKSGEIVNAARHGVRLGVTPDATSAAVTSGVQTFMTSAGMGGSGYSVTLTPSDVTAMQPGETLTVRVTVPYPAITITGMPLIPVPGQLRAEVSMAKEGP